MPLYEYTCRACQQQFEFLVRPGGTPTCPACQSADLERATSAFAVSTPGLRQSRLKDARAAHARGQKDRLIAEKEEREHHRH